MIYEKKKFNFKYGDSGFYSVDYKSSIDSTDGEKKNTILCNGLVLLLISSRRGGSGVLNLLEKQHHVLLSSSIRITFKNYYASFGSASP